MRKKLLLLPLAAVLFSCEPSEQGLGNLAKEISDKTPNEATQEELVDGITSTEHRVFVTSSRHGGNLGGIEGANTICQNLAGQAGLQKTYKALLGRVGMGTLSNIADNGGELYTFTSDSNKLKVANTLSDFTQNNIISDAKFDESYAVTSHSAWTGISDQGQTDRTCNDWTSPNDAMGAYNGYPNSSPECVDPNEPFNFMAQIHNNQSDCENGGFEWRDNIGANSVGGVASVCTGDGVDNNSKHLYCISE
jgi:hypothetical protein